MRNIDSSEILIYIFKFTPPNNIADTSIFMLTQFSNNTEIVHIEL